MILFNIIECYDKWSKTMKLLQSYNNELFKITQYNYFYNTV